MSESKEIFSNIPACTQDNSVAVITEPSKQETTAQTEVTKKVDTVSKEVLEKIKLCQNDFLLACNNDISLYLTLLNIKPTDVVTKTLTRTERACLNLIKTAMLPTFNNVYKSPERGIELYLSEKIQAHVQKLEEISPQFVENIAMLDPVTPYLPKIYNLSEDDLRQLIAVLQSSKKGECSREVQELETFYLNSKSEIVRLGLLAAAQEQLKKKEVPIRVESTEKVEDVSNEVRAKIGAIQTEFVKKCFNDMNFIFKVMKAQPTDVPTKILTNEEKAFLNLIKICLVPACKQINKTPEHGIELYLSEKISDLVKQIDAISHQHVVNVTSFNLSLPYLNKLLTFTKEDLTLLLTSLEDVNSYKKESCSEAVQEIMTYVIDSKSDDVRKGLIGAFKNELKKKS